MAGQLYATDAARIGKINGRILKQAMFDECLTMVGQHEQIPKNRGDTVTFRRFLPFGGVDNEWIAAGGDATYVTQHLTAEGQTPSADSIDSTDIPATLLQYSCLYSYSDKTALMYEDDLPAEMEKQAGIRIQLVREMHLYGKLKAGTNKFYGGTGTSTATVNGAVTPTKLRAIKRDLQRYHCDPVTEVIGAGPNFSTRPVDAGYVIYCHTDLESDLYDLPNFIKVSEYANRKPISKREIGSWESFRFVTNPILAYNAGGGVVVASGPGLKADDSTNIDVYPMVCVGEKAFAQVALRGEEAISSNHIPHNKPSKSDPGGQRGYLWASAWYVAEIMNQDWMAILEVGVTDL